MKILIVHNRYREAGGEDAVVQTEFNLLKNFKEEVRLYERSNTEIDDYSFSQKLNFLWRMGRMGSTGSSCEELRRILREFKPDVVHFHNIFFILTPAVYQVCIKENIPVVQSLHNFRLLCSNALFFRNNKVCEECFEQKNLWRGVRYGCYKNSRGMTALLVRMLENHWKRGTWIKDVDMYITATEFGRKKYIAAGIPSERIVVKPNIDVRSYSKIPVQLRVPRGVNMWEDPHWAEGPTGDSSRQDDPQQLCADPKNGDGGYALYAGRLSSEKGVDVLLKAWKKKAFLPLKIAGDGPLAAQLKEDARGIQNVEFLGFIPSDRYQDYFKNAKFLIVPSLCYENFPRVVAEAYRYGIPVVASDLGGFPEIVLDQQTGALFRAGDEDDLLKKIQWLVSQDQERPSMQKKIHELYTTLYSERRNYETLKDVYSQAIARKKNAG